MSVYQWKNPNGNSTNNEGHSIVILYALSHPKKLMHTQRHTHKQTYIYIYIYIVCVCYFTPWEFFTSELVDNFSLKLEWQQVSSSFQDSSQYSQQCCSLDSFHPPQHFQVFQSLYQSFGDCTKSTNYNRYTCHFHIPRSFQFPCKVEVLIPLFAFFHFFLCYLPGQQSLQSSKSSFFFVDYNKVCTSGRD